MKPIPASRSCRRCGFTLVEVIVAVGMVTFALVTVVALLPSGLKSHQFATDQARNVQVLNDLARAVKGVHKEGAGNRFLPPLESVSVGSGTSNLWLYADGTVSSTKPQQRDLRGAVRIEQLSSPVAGTLPVSISVAWPGTATYQGGKWTKHEGSVSTLQFITLPD
jgi:type II secretory pathway pseudopilin PulG